MVLVDTNILLHAINADSPDHERCAAALESLVNNAENWAVTWSIVYEFLRVATHPRVFPNPLAFDRAYAYVQEWMACDSCYTISESEHHLDVLGESTNQTGRLTGNIIHNLHSAALMHEHGITDVLTLDRDFRTFPWVRIRPVAGW